jgi:threonyl-tRNA synthetase
LVLTKEEALNLFKHNNFKVSMITNKIPDGSRVTAYKCGTLIDLCTGPHIPASTMIKAFRIEKNSSAYWLGKAGNDSLQRVYGITFPDKKLMDEHILFQEEAKKRDHRTIGQKQDLFHINELSPGCAFFYPKGMIIYNALMDMIRSEYRVRGYNEVMSPNIFNLHLWKTSGHYVNYKDNIFMVKVENHGHGCKPMNCPAHCLMFNQELRSFRDLPFRLADFGVLHRNEISGALSGLTRVRRFQ